jgi:hypothetical protein
MLECANKSFEMVYMGMDAAIADLIREKLFIKSLIHNIVDQPVQANADDRCLSWPFQLKQLLGHL